MATLKYKQRSIQNPILFCRLALATEQTDLAIENETDLQ